MSRIAKDFLTRCFAPGETIALLLRTESPASTQQRVVALEQALAPRYLAWLARENHHGANIYAAANPLRPGSRKRTKESIASVRHLYLDIDEDGDARIFGARRIGVGDDAFAEGFERFQFRRLKRYGAGDNGHFERRGLMEVSRLVAHFLRLRAECRQRGRRQG